MSNKKEWIYEKLNRLVKFCKATEPDQPDDKHLFMPTIIDAYDMLNDVEDSYDEMTSSEIKKIMVEAIRYGDSEERYGLVMLTGIGKVNWMVN